MATNACRYNSASGSVLRRIYAPASRGPRQLSSSFSSIAVGNRHEPQRFGSTPYEAFQAIRSRHDDNEFKATLFSGNFKKKAKVSKKPSSADSGRIVVHESGKSKKSKGPSLCAGCGTEVQFVGTGHHKKGNMMGITTGQEAVDTTLSKKKSKLARFYDTFGGTKEFFCNRCKVTQYCCIHMKISSSALRLTATFPYFPFLHHIGIEGG